LFKYTDHIQIKKQIQEIHQLVVRYQKTYMIIRLHHSNTGTMAPENRNKGSNAPSVRSLVVDREDEAGGQWVTGGGQCFVLPSVLWHCWWVTKRTLGAKKLCHLSPKVLCWRYWMK